MRTFLIFVIFLTFFEFALVSSISFEFKDLNDEHSYSLPFEKIFIINLKRRQDKRIAMEGRINELNVKIPYQFVTALDGNNITREWLKENDAAPLISWRDPKMKRTLTRGEIGCMLSHIVTWDEIIESGIKSALILEDDSIFGFVRSKKKQFFFK